MSGVLKRRSDCRICSRCAFARRRSDRALAPSPVLRTRSFGVGRKLRSGKRSAKYKITAVRLEPERRIDKDGLPGDRIVRQQEQRRCGDLLRGDAVFERV